MIFFRQLHKDETMIHLKDGILFADVFLYNIINNIICQTVWFQSLDSLEKRLMHYFSDKLSA